MKLLRKLWQIIRHLFTWPDTQNGKQIQQDDSLYEFVRVSRRTLKLVKEKTYMESDAQVLDSALNLMLWGIDLELKGYTFVVVKNENVKKVAGEAFQLFEDA